MKKIKNYFADAQHFLWRHPGHLFWVALVYIPFLGRFSIPLTGDQKVYLSTALEMREKGSFLQPYLFGEPSYFKPPFQYWMTLWGWNVFGLNLWGALIPSVLAVVLTAWLLGEIAYLLHERKEFVNAGLWFASALGVITFGTTAQMEIYLCFFYAASWWAGLRFLSKPPQKRRAAFLYLALGLAGLAALVKSPLYSIFWVSGFFSYLILSGEWELFKSRHLTGALLLGILLGASWYIAILVIDGENFWAQYVVRENFEKAGGNRGTILGLWSALLYFCFPFTLLILPALKAFWKGRHVGNGLRFLMAWSWPPLLFFSAYPYRNKPYAFILVPLLSILVDWGYFRSGRTRFYRMTTLMSSSLMLIGYTLVSVVLYRAQSVPDWIVLGWIGVGVWSFICGFKDWMRGLVLCGIAGVLLFRLTAISLGEKDIATLRTLHASHPEAKIALLDEKKNIWNESGLLTAALGVPVLRLTHFDQVVPFLKTGGIVLLDEEQSKLLNTVDLKSLEETIWLRWKKRTHFPYEDFILGGRSAVPDFENLTHRQFKILRLK